MNEPIVFIGAGPVAAASLALLTDIFTIEAVITKPRPDHFHGEVPVLDIAKRHRIPIIEVTNKKDVTEKIIAHKFKSRVAVLIDFGIIIEQKVIDSFPLGIVNSHFSLLPQWRGADPITFAILSGQDVTGVSLMLLVQAMDEGPLLAVGEVPLHDKITITELTDELIDVSFALLTDILPKYVSGELQESPQEAIAELVGYSSKPTYSRKLTKEDSVLDWNKPAEQLAREVRAFLDWPKSRAVIGRHAVILTAAHAEGGNGMPGALWLRDKRLGIYCADGILVIDRLKPAGKADMSAESFLNGYGKSLNT